MNYAISYMLMGVLLLSLITPKKNKKTITIVIFLFLALLWGFQYDMAVDWDVNVNRWLSVNVSKSYAQDVELEPFYVFIMSLSKPIGCYGFFIFTALSSMSVIFLIYKQILPFESLFLFLITFICDENNYMWLSNSNRQTWAIMFFMIAIYIMSTKAQLNIRNKYFLISTSFIIMAVFTHRSSILVIPVLFLPFYVEKIRSNKYLYIFIIIEILSFYVDLTSFATVTDIFLSSNSYLEDYHHYAEEIAERDKSIIQQSIYLILNLLLVINFNNFKKEEKIVAISSMVFFSLQGFVMYNALRALLYYRIYVAFAIPMLYLSLKSRYEDKSLFKVSSLSFISVYVAYMIFRYINDVEGGENFDGYSVFKTLFSVQNWI